jgi:hypothetical protein
MIKIRGSLCFFLNWLREVRRWHITQIMEAMAKVKKKRFNLFCEPILSEVNPDQFNLRT